MQLRRFESDFANLIVIVIDYIANLIVIDDYFRD